MFDYFPTNYVWNLATNLALGAGGLIGEVNEPCRVLKDAAVRNDDIAQEEWVQAWTRLAGKVENQARTDESAGNLISAGRKYLRASMYHFTAERQAHPRDPRKTVMYRHVLECFGKGIAYRKESVERVEIPYGNTLLPALFVPVEGGVRAPCMVHFDGLDVLKEWIYLTGIGGELRRRGIALLIVDHPGVGEALRLRKLPSIPEVERPAGAALEFLAGRKEVDSARVGIMALSLGGYYAPRVAAFEKRMKCCVAWGAQWNWHERVVARLNPSASIQRSVSHFAEHLNWVFGKESIEETLKITAQFDLRDVAHRITCPLLVVHGENDRQIPLSDAEALVEAARSSPQRELKVFTLADGGAEHCQADNGSLAVDYMCDWIARTLGGRVD